MYDKITKDKKGNKPKSSNPLGMPQGSVRALLAFLLVIVASYMLIQGIPVPEWYSILVVSGMSFYFGTRKTTAKPE